MTFTFEIPAALVARSDDDFLFQLLLRVARRADEVARESDDPRIPIWFAWMRAEREVFSGLEM
jgi:hypothetical protein